MKFFLTFGYSGLSPVMPGTVGSLAALVPVLLVNYFFNYVLAQTILLFGIIGFFFLGVLGCRDYATQLFGEEDPSSIVIDEVVGIWIAVWLWDLPPQAIEEFQFYGWGELLVAFLLFRLLDITKVGGIKRLEKIPHGWGVMLDDLAAGLITFAIIRIWNGWV